MEALGSAPISRSFQSVRNRNRVKSREPCVRHGNATEPRVIPTPQAELLETMRATTPSKLTASKEEWLANRSRGAKVSAGHQQARGSYTFWEPAFWESRRPLLWRASW